jgi:site-specific DNA-methyltransferase (adenine-specific)
MDADGLTGDGVRHGDSGESWRGIDVTAKGRHWANTDRGG